MKSFILFSCLVAATAARAQDPNASLPLCNQAGPETEGYCRIPGEVSVQVEGPRDTLLSLDALEDLTINAGGSVIDTYSSDWSEVGQQFSYVSLSVSSRVAAGSEEDFCAAVLALPRLQPFRPDCRQRLGGIIVGSAGVRN